MANAMQYRGYVGSIEASPEDGILYGKLLYIRPLVTYEGQTVPELKNAFEEAVDLYLADCDEEGVAPEKPCKGSFNVRIGHHMHFAAVQAAGREHKSLNELVRHALEAYLANDAHRDNAR